MCWSITGHVLIKCRSCDCHVLLIISCSLCLSLQRFATPKFHHSRGGGGGKIILMKIGGEGGKGSAHDSM